MTHGTFAIALLVAASVVPAFGQSPAVDPRWAPYLGCWTLQRENTGDGTTDLFAAAAREARPDQRRDSVMICVTSSDQPNAVAQQTVLNNETILDEVVSADGTVRTSTEGECRSTRRAEWSASGRQLYTSGTVACAGKPERRLSGLMMMMPGPTWVDVQMADVQGRRSVRVRRYVMSREQARTARRDVGSPPPMDRWTLDEVKDASRHAAPEVLQAALVEVGTKLPLNSQRLIDLDRAGVPGSVVDVMVALTYPEKFTIEQPSSSSGGFGGFGGFGGYVDPFLVASQWGWLSMYSPFGYQYYGYYDPLYGPGNGWVIVNPPGGGGTVEPDANGRVVNGLGYTRVQPREPEPRVTGDVDRSGGSWGGGNNGGSGGSGVTSGGYSGGGGGDSGRTAVPRPPGGDR